MRIKEKCIKDNYIEFVISPCFTSEALVKRCRALVDDYFTFINFEHYSQYYNFRKYCLEPIFEEKNDIGFLVGIVIKYLKYQKFDITFNVKKSGYISISIPDELHEDERQTFFTRFERMIEYAL